MKKIMLFFFLSFGVVSVTWPMGEMLMAFFLCCCGESEEQRPYEEWVREKDGSYTIYEWVNEEQNRKESKPRKKKIIRYIKKKKIKKD